MQFYATNNVFSRKRDLNQSWLFYIHWPLITKQLFLIYIFYMLSDARGIKYDPEYQI